MTPHFFINYAADVALIGVKCFGKFALIYTAVVIAFTYLQNLFVGQFSRTSVFTSSCCSATFTPHIVIVFLMRSSKQVGGIAARSVVALVADAKCVVQMAVSEFVGY